MRRLLTRAISTEPDILDSCVLVLDKSMTADKNRAIGSRRKSAVSGDPLRRYTFLHIYFIQTRVWPPNKKIIIIKNTKNIAIITKSIDKKNRCISTMMMLYVVRGGQRGPSPRVMQSTDRRNRIMSSRTIIIIPKTSKTLGFAHINYIYIARNAFKTDRHVGTVHGCTVYTYTYTYIYIYYIFMCTSRHTHTYTYIYVYCILYVYMYIILYTSVIHCCSRPSGPSARFPWEYDMVFHHNIIYII